MSRLPEVESQSGLLQRVFSRRGIVANFLMRRHLDADSPIQPQLQLQPAPVLDSGLSRRGFLGKASAYVAVVALGLKAMDAVSNRPAQLAAGPAPDGTAGPEAVTTPEPAVSVSPTSRKLKGPTSTPTKAPDQGPIADGDLDDDNDPGYSNLPLRSQPMYMNRFIPGGVLPKAMNEKDCFDHMTDPRNSRTPRALRAVGVEVNNLTGPENIVLMEPLKDIAKQAQEKNILNEVLAAFRGGQRFFELNFFVGDNLLWQVTEIVDMDPDTLKEKDPQAFDTMTKISIQDVGAVVQDPKTGNTAVAINECDNVLRKIKPKPKATAAPSTPTPGTTTSPVPTPDVTPAPTAAPGSGSPSGSGPSGSSPSSSGGGPSSSTETPTSTPGSGVVATPTTETSPRPTFTPQGTPLPPTPRPTFTPQPTPAAPTPRPTFTPQPPPSATPRAGFTPSSQTSASASAAASSSPRPGFTPSR